MQFSTSDFLMNSANSSASSRVEGLPPALRVTGLSYYYGTQKAIEGITMDIPQHQVTAIIGPSGCGKSTFIKALNRIGELEGKVRVEGKVEFFGQNIYSPQVNLNRLRRQIGMVFQKPNPFPMSIYNNVAYGIRVFSPTSRTFLDESVESALQGAALWDEVKDNLGKSALGLSGGQQQRLCIARALAVKPKILLMDEPCSALDPISTQQVEQLCLDLKEHYTIIMVTHNMQQASRVSDWTAFFNTETDEKGKRRGKLVEFSPTRDIFNAPKTEETSAYISGRFG